MTYYLLDTENLKYNWMPLIEPKERDKIIFFYTQKCGAIPKNKVESITKKLKGNCNSLKTKIQTFDELSSVVHNNKVFFDTVKCITGKNALDFQLVSYLGMLIYENSNANFVIISNDNGYKPVISMWSNKGVKIKQIKYPEIKKKNKKLKKAS